MLDHAAREVVRPAGIEVTRQATEILTQAQNLADQLRAEAQADAEAMRAELARNRDMNDTLLRTAAEKQSHAEAAAAAATARLDEARHDAVTLLEDASAQASLITRTAERTAAEVIALSRAEAERILTDAKLTSDGLNENATKAVEEVRDRLAAYAAEVDADLKAKTQAWEAEESQRRRDLDEHVVRTHTQAEAQLAQRLSEHETHIATTTSKLADERKRWDEELAALQAAAQAEHDALVEQAQSIADEQLASAAAHVAWTQEAMAELKATAQAETDAVRRQHHEELTEHVRTVRERTQLLLTSADHRGQALVSEAQATAEGLQARAHALLAAAEKDAVQTRQRAEEEAQRLLETARTEAQAQEARATRRLADAESGAKLIRERAATDLEALQRETYESVRSTREEAIALLAQARIDADQARTEARSQLEKARAEVATLARRRDDINAQLGHLSGVIEALAVSDQPGTRTTSASQHSMEEE